MTIIVCYTRTSLLLGNPIDHYEVVETMAEAVKFYDDLILRDDVYSASVCGVIKSTDYEPYEAI